MKVTIYDVAEKAGVSIATVSKVINNTGRISEKTRKKVQEVMTQLNYQPSMVASALTRKRTGTIGLLVPDIANPFFAEVARSFEDCAQKLGFGLVICSTDGKDEKANLYLSLLMRKQVDGLIIASYIKETALVEQMLKEKIPVVLFTIDIPTLGINSVSVDDYKGGFQATSYLLSLGHKHIGVIAEDISRSYHRVQGYKEAIIRAGMNLNESNIIYTTAAIENGKMVARQLLQRKEDRPTAIFACNDLLAIGAIEEARKLGINIPEELSIIGFDNTILAEIANPTLTSVSQPIKEMANQAMTVLLEEIENEQTSKQRTLMLPELVIRNSTAPI
ncbi:LacI family DNA-binding transcriptional regulator [Bacillus songklensis]|uniref:LacI family DNA-binding transcriptional regulator n=1 Tax=Bacillus songklensis TaxID=1069116 RepID=A0ABV8B5H6_9BACI